jgi:thioredoxin 1
MTPAGLISTFALQIAVVAHMPDELEQIKIRKISEMMERARKSKPSVSTTSPLNLTDNDFESTIRANKLVIVDCWAAWCYPCRLISPIVEELANEYSSVALFAKLNVDENPITASRYYVQNIPTILIIKNGIEVDRVIGAVLKAQIEAALRKHL